MKVFLPMGSKLGSERHRTPPSTVIDSYSRTGLIPLVRNKLIYTTKLPRAIFGLKVKFLWNTGQCFPTGYLQDKMTHQDAYYGTTLSHLGYVS